MLGTRTSGESNRYNAAAKKGRAWLLGIASALFLALPAASAEHLFHVVFDTDEAAATGCTVDFPTQGSVGGFEAQVELRVDPDVDPPVVESIRWIPCEGGQWNSEGGATTAAGWNIGVNTGQAGGDLAEGFVSLEALGSPESLRMFVRSTTIDGNEDDIDSQVLTPIVLDLSEPVPAIEPIGLLLLCLALLGFAFWRLQHRAVRAFVLLLALGIGVRAVHALPVPHSLAGSVADWVGISPLALDPIEDAGEPAADILAFFATPVATHLVFRFDVADLEIEYCPDDTPAEELDSCGWGRWGPFSACSTSCGDGVRTRERVCHTGEPGSDHCQGSDTESEDCSVGDFACGWSAWTDWDECDNPCGGGMQRRYRSCFSNNPNNCVGMDTDLTFCVGGDGMCGWTEWSGPLDCSNPCGDGTAQYVRSCIHGDPDVNCMGGDSYEEPCTGGGPYCGWTDWGPFDTCSISCGNGTQSRSRSCVSNNPEANCADGSVEIDFCNIGSATCGWSEWSAFDTCSNSCGDGTQTRTRTCSSNAPWENCQGASTENIACTDGSTTCGWSAWSEFGSCTTVCGGGIQNRTRTCESNNNSANCEGSATSTQACNTQLCPIYDLLSEETLEKNEFISSPDHNCQLYMQANGDLQVSCGADSIAAPGTGNPVASDWFPTGTDGNSGAYAILQGDGNFVVYNSGGLFSLWETETTGFGGARLTIDNDGVVTLRDGLNGVVWSSAMPVGGPDLPGGPGDGCGPFDPGC